MVANTSKVTTALLLAILATATSSVSAQASSITLVPAGTGTAALENLNLLEQYVNAVSNGALVAPQAILNNPIYVQAQTNLNRRRRTTNNVVNDGDFTIVNRGMTPEVEEIALQLHNMLQNTAANPTYSTRQRRRRAAAPNQGPVVFNVNMSPAEEQMALQLHEYLQGLPAAQTTPMEARSRRRRTTANDFVNYDLQYDGSLPFVVDAGLDAESLQFGLDAHAYFNGL